MNPRTVVAQNQVISRVSLGCLCVLPSLLPVYAQSSPTDNNLQAEVMRKALNNAKFRGVQATVHDGLIRLTGTVDVFDLKEEIDRRVHRIKGVKGVDNEIHVGGETLTDSVLQDKLTKAIEYDRVGYGTTAFNAIGVNVQNGVVTLSGHAYGPVDADSGRQLLQTSRG